MPLFLPHLAYNYKLVLTQSLKPSKKGEALSLALKALRHPKARHPNRATQTALLKPAPLKPAPLKDHRGFPQGAAAHLAPGWWLHFYRNCDRLVLKVIRVEWRGIVWRRWTSAL
jgi:hypothetical protein